MYNQIMNPKQFKEAIWLRNRSEDVIAYNAAYRTKHPEYKQFMLPNRLWFKVYRKAQMLHWAIIDSEKECYIYFININGRVFDRYKVKDVKTAEKLLYYNGFRCKNKNKIPYLPIEPIFTCVTRSKRVAIYSRGGLFKKDKLNIDKLFRVFIGVIILVCILKLLMNING